MPDQACANGLKLHDIPQDLDSITPLECTLLAKCIPFLTILLMKRYGGHYKVNGPCVNVPTQLDQVLTILPQMSSELQLHPLKLKHKLEYKNHYMYHVIQKDSVIGAIIWLKPRTVISCQPSEEDKADNIIKYAKDVLEKVQNALSSIQIANEDLAIADLVQKVGIDLDTYM